MNKTRAPQRQENGSKRVNAIAQGPKITTVDEIQAGLYSQDQETFTRTLTSLRNQFTLKNSDASVSPQDPRLILAQQWLIRSPGAQDIFGIWEGASQQQTALISLLISVLSALLSLLSSHYTYHGLGYPIIKTLLSSQWSRKLNAYLAGSHNDLILVTLKLFNSASLFASGRERKAVLEAFPWEVKSLPKLLNMRRRNKTNEDADPLTRPDIRTLYILLVLSFVDQNTPIQVKAAFLEQHRDKFISIFKGLVQDPYVVVRKVLEVCWAGIWSDPKLKRTTKIGLFNELTISHVAKLYDRVNEEDEDPDHIPADLVHHFLLAICTRPGVGICFRDRGWYPRESDAEERPSGIDDDPETRTGSKDGGKLHNKMLGNVLKTLKANEDLRQQELAMKIMSACPELVAGYWIAAGLTLEPRLSSRWIANIALFGSIISLPIPSSTFILSDAHGTLYHPSPPPLSTITENILPSVNIKNHFSKGLQQTTHGLVQHCTALALAKCLIKYQKVVQLFRTIADALEENEEDGQWSKRLRDLEREIRKRVPDFQVIVAFSQQKSAVTVVAGDEKPVPAPNETKLALLAESAQRLLWLYHRCLPELVSEARFDVGKLLLSFSDTAQLDSGGDEGEESRSAAARLHDVGQLHVLRLLKDNDQFSWSGKAAASKHSYFYVLLKAYATSHIQATRETLTSLLEHTLSSSILFQDSTDEPYLWLICLPTSRRAPGGGESPDSAVLTDEVESVITFLDDCVQRGLKTPYRYIEDLHAQVPVSTEAGQQPQSDTPDVSQQPSPLLMTILEQLAAKLTSKLFSPSDVLAVSTYIRKLLFRLSTVQEDVSFLIQAANRFDGSLAVDKLFSEFPAVTSAIRHEVDMLRVSLGLPTSSPLVTRDGSRTEVASFIDEIDQMPIPSEASAQVVAASELVDWMRLIDQPLSSSEIRKLTAIILRFHPSTLRDFSQNISPASSVLWDGMDIVSNSKALLPYLDFDWLFVSTSPTLLSESSCRDVLVEAAFTAKPTLTKLKKVMRLVTRDLDASETHIASLLQLIGAILERSSGILPSSDFIALKEFTFVRCSPMKSLLTSPSTENAIQKILVTLVDIAFRPESKNDKDILSEISSHWLNLLRTYLETKETLPLGQIACWTRYLPSRELFGLLGPFQQSLEDNIDESVVEALKVVLDTLNRATEFDADAAFDLQEYLPQLLGYPRAVGSALEDLIATAMASSLPTYYDGGSASKPHDGDTLDSVTERSDLKWHRRLQLLPKEVQLLAYLENATWSNSTIKIICRVLHEHPCPNSNVSSWLLTDRCHDLPVSHFATVMHAYLDIINCSGAEVQPSDSEPWLLHFSRLSNVVVDEEQPMDLRSICGACVSLMLRLTPPKLDDTVASLVKLVDNLPTTSLTPEIVAVGNQLHGKSPTGAKPLMDALAHHGLQWAVRYVSSAGDSHQTRAIVEQLIILVKTAPNLKPHLVEPFLTAVSQSQLSYPGSLDLLTATVGNVQLKPLIVNRTLQSIVQHPHFYRVCGISTRTSAGRDACLKALHVLFNLHPANTCQITHVEPLVRLYGGTLSNSDRMLLSIFQLFEEQRKTSIASLFSRWSSSPDVTSKTVLEAVQSLDANLVLRTCLQFPKRRRLEGRVDDYTNLQQSQLYDPVFLILLLAQTLADDVPETAPAWVELFRTNIVGLLIRGLSSSDDLLREVSISQLATLWKLLETADMQEKPHVVHILTLLKDTIPPPTGEPPIRLPSYTTLILAHALRGIFYPSNFIYPMTARFLMQRPTLDTTDVPMLYNMLYSSSDNWKKERGWIIRFLSDGMHSTDDWRVFKRRHTWDLLASMFQSTDHDRPLRRGVFEVMANLTCISQATTTLVLKNSLLTWIEMQVLDPREDEIVAWIKVLENIITVVDQDKVESLTNGEWRSVIARCLSMLLTRSTSANALIASTLISRVMLRLGLLPGPPIPGLAPLLARAVECLQHSEKGTSASRSSLIVASDQKTDFQLPPHSAYTLLEPESDIDPLRLWGNSVECLWRVGMTLTTKTSSWDLLTSRLLIWRGIVGAERSPVGEWARREVIQNLATRSP